MNKEKDYNSDSDTSDEDFCPDKNDAGNSELSEEATDDEIEDNDGDIPTEETEQKKRGTKVKRQTNKKREKSRKKKSRENAINAETKEGDRRITRQVEQTFGNNINSEKLKEKNELAESDDEQKSHSDALWADFLSDVKQPHSTAEKTDTNTNKTTKDLMEKATTNGDGNKPSTKSTNSANGVTPEKITITEIFDFAGETVTMEKTVDANSIKGNLITKKVESTAPTIRNIKSGIPVSGLKRTASNGASGSSGGLGSLLNQIGKKKKMSVLEKTKLDWNGFKHEEGIEEQLQIHNKGKDGYLQRQDFLQRTDLRQFEIEKNLRQSHRKF